jgi:hypothetical protein
LNQLPTDDEDRPLNFFFAFEFLAIALVELSKAVRSLSVECPKSPQFRGGLIRNFGVVPETIDREVKDKV